jgi:hypothetical protein
MSVTVANDLWNELRRFLSTPDRAEAADAVVALLIDNDYDAEDIRSAFKGDKDIKQALESYIDDTDDDPEEDLEDLDEDEY